jgi:hypothetical protein
VLTYQGQLVQRRLEFQAHQVISVGVAASAMPSAEAEAVGAVDIPEDLTELSSSSSSRTESASETASTSSAFEAQHSAMQSSSSAAGGEDSSVSSDSVASESEGELTDDSSSWPDYERFKLLIRSIQAEVEF